MNMHPKFHEFNGDRSGGLYPQSQLKVSRESHLIKKPNSSSPFPSPSPSPSPTPTPTPTPTGNTVVSPAEPPKPVIIYSVSPRIIHTNPKDFKALVQKLTGMPTDEQDPPLPAPSPTDHARVPEKRSADGPMEDIKNIKPIIGNNRAVIGDESESSSEITIDENMGEIGQMTSSMFMAAPPGPPPLPSQIPFYDPLENYSYFSKMPVYGSNPTDNLLCGNQPILDFDADSSFFAPDMRSSFSSSSSSGFDALTEFHDF